MNKKKVTIKKRHASHELRGKCLHSIRTIRKNSPHLGKREFLSIFTDDKCQHHAVAVGGSIDE